ncbi:hypothetical protein C8J57DRAFT_1339013, partial [Mycena rebaudengoi]
MLGTGTPPSSSARSIVLGTDFHRHRCSSLVPSTSRSWLPLESGFGWIQANSAPLSAVFQPFPSLEAVCRSLHPPFASFHWRCIFFSSFLVSIFFHQSSFFSHFISPTTGFGNITVCSGNDGRGVSEKRVPWSRPVVLLRKTFTPPSWSSDWCSLSSSTSSS